MIDKADLHRIHQPNVIPEDWPEDAVDLAFS
jgi:hypothetical protein